MNVREQLVRAVICVASVAGGMVISQSSFEQSQRRYDQQIERALTSTGIKRTEFVDLEIRVRMLQYSIDKIERQLKE